MTVSPPLLSPRFRCIAALLVGGAAAAWAGALDVSINMREEPASFALASWLLWLAIALGVVPILACAAAILMWPLRSRISRALYVGLLGGCALQTLALLYLDTVRALLSVGPVWICGLLVARVPGIDRLGRLALLAMGCTLAAAATVLVAVAAGHSSLGWRALADPALPATAPTHRAPLPNVVLIVLDTTRRDHLGVYGHTGNLTPNLDRFAAGATVYETAISPADWTAPSHASLFTGWYPPTHGVSFAHHRWLDDHFQTLAEMLRGNGFQTVGLAANRYLQMTNLHQGFDHYVLTWNDRGSYLTSAAQLLGFPDRWVDKGAHRTVDELARWMDHSYHPEQPLFLFVNLLESHWRYLPPAPQRASTLPADVPYWRATRVSAGFHPIHWLGGQAHSRQDEEAMRGLYAAEVAYQDQQLGRLLDALRQRIDLDHTLVIVTADHGENLGEGGRWDHTFAVNDHLVHVPLIIRYPGGAQSGQRIRGQCQTVDILPTIFAVLRRELPVHGLPGRSLLPDQFQPRATTFSESVPFFDHSQRLSSIAGMRRDIARFTRVLHAARSDRFKYVAANDGTEMLFDLAADPDEIADVAAAHPDVVHTLRAELRGWQRALAPYAPASPGTAPGAADRASPGLSEAERERLRQLGYMQ